VSFLSALVHHGALVDSLALIQVASPDRAGRDQSITPGPVLFLPIPRDLFFGWRVEPFEGTSAPVAGVEKALLDWVYWCEEHGLEARLDEIEWEVIDLDLLERLAREMGVEYRASLFGLTAASDSSHDQDRLRADRWRARQLEDEADLGAIQEAKNEPLYDQEEAESYIFMNPVRRERLDRGWTQQELARRLGVSQATVAKWERKGANYRKGTREKLAKVFGKGEETFR
jgi:transcriptional regulator with XRE-family HTH domain